MNTELPDAAVQKLTAQIGEALFGQPGLDLIEIANRCNSEVARRGGALLSDIGNPVSGDARAQFEAWAEPILGDNPDWRESGSGELARQAWQAALATVQPSPDSLGDGWVSFNDRWPNESRSLDDPKVVTTDKVLVTNNLKSRDAMGRMSHVWWASPIKPDRRGGEVVAFTEADRKLHALTHWRDPFAVTQPSPAGQGDVPYDVARDLLADAYNAGRNGIGFSEQVMRLGDALAARQPMCATVKDSLTVGGGQTLAIEAPTGHPPRAWTAEERQAATDAMRRIIAREKEDAALQPEGQPMQSDLSGYAVAASQVRRGYDVECGHCGKFCDEGPGPCQPVGQEPFAYTRATTVVDPLPVITPAEYAGLRAQGHGAGMRALVFADSAPPAQGWLVADGQGVRWRMWGDSGPEWTSDRNQALHFSRRCDAEAFSRDDEDAWLIQPVGTPAQAVDFGQFREAVLCWRREQASRSTYVPEAESSPSDNVKKADQLLAMIDSGKAVQS